MEEVVLDVGARGGYLRDVRGGEESAGRLYYLGWWEVVAVTRELQAGMSHGCCLRHIRVVTIKSAAGACCLDSPRMAATDSLGGQQWPPPSSPRAVS
jgi:hypothetical protein